MHKNRSRHTRPSIGYLLVLIALAGQMLAPRAARGQEEPGRLLSLDDAIQDALAGNADMQVARMRARMAEASSGGAAATLWPQVDLSTGFVRSDDPVFAFGTKLRQQSFGADDLDVGRLNSPDPLNDWATVVSARWDILSPRLWAEKSSAGREARSAAYTETRSRELTILRTRALYLDGLRTARHLAAAIKAEEAANSTRDLFQSRVERGLLTEAELLGGEAELAFARAARIDADRASIDSRQRLAVFLGWQPEVPPILSDSLVVALNPDRGLMQGKGGVFDPALRSDLLALEASADAASFAHRRAGYSWLPDVGAFANWAMHGADAFSDDGNYWTVGVALRWKIFGGFSRSAESKLTAAAELAARTRYDEGLRLARAEVEEAERGVASASESLAATITAYRASTAAADLMRRRFEEGLATATDLLVSEARMAESERAAVDSAASLEIAKAKRRFVTTQIPREEDR